jgi:hypothetical protein
LRRAINILVQRENVPCGHPAGRVDAVTSC